MSFKIQVLYDKRQGMVLRVKKIKKHTYNTLPNGQMLFRSALTGSPNVRKRRPVFPPASRSLVLVHSPDGVLNPLPV